MTQQKAPDAQFLREALLRLLQLPKVHQTSAFFGVLLTSVGLTLVASLVARKGADFLVGAPIVAFVVFILATLALLSRLKPDSSAGLVGLFYFLPGIYAVMILGLAFISRSEAQTPAETAKSIQDTRTSIDESKRDIKKILDYIAQRSEGQNQVSSSNDKVAKPLNELAKAIDESNGDISVVSGDHSGFPVSDGVVSGTISNLNGEPVEECEISVLEDQTGNVLARTIAHLGRYQISYKSKGSISLLFRAQGRVTKLMRGLSPGDDQVMRIVLPELDR